MKTIHEQDLSTVIGGKPANDTPLSYDITYGWIGIAGIIRTVLRTWVENNNGEFFYT